MLKGKMFFSTIIISMLSVACSLDGNNVGNKPGGPIENGPEAGDTIKENYTITFHPNRGNGMAPTAQTVQAGSSIILPNGSGLSNIGYTFRGWNTNASGTGLNYDAGSPYIPSESITLYAKWIRDDVPWDEVTFKISFSPNGATGNPPNTQTVNSGSSITFPNRNTLSKSNSVFGGWSTNASGMGTTYQPGDSYMPNSNIVFYAIWSNAYIVTFNANSGNGSPPAALTVQAGSIITLPNASGLSKSGSTFGGWNTNASGTGTTYQPGDPYIPISNITLFAKWDAASITSSTNLVTFNTNGGIGSVPPAQTVQTGSSITLPNGSGLSKSGSTFGGWNTNASGTGANYNAGASYTVTGNITFYAKWDAANIPASTSLVAQLSWLQSYAQSGGIYTLELSANESISPQTLSYSSKRDITILLRGIGSMRTISLSSNGNLFKIGSGVTLILDNNILLQGRNNNTASLIQVNGGGNLIMNMGATITGNRTASYHGGGVFLYGGAFTMNGGTISGNTAGGLCGGGGVYVQGDGRFTGSFILNNGTISGNTAYSGGGVFISSGSFSKTGGTITG